MEKKGSILLIVGTLLIVIGSLFVSSSYDFVAMPCFVLAILILFYSVVVLNKKDKS